jgi:polyribonucleotide nucleotidyltransferase
MKKAIDEAAQRFKMYERFSRYGESTQEEYYEFYLDELIEFVELFIKEEREACARVCEEDVRDEYIRQDRPAQDEAFLFAAIADCAEAIRARGTV